MAKSPNTYRFLDPVRGKDELGNLQGPRVFMVDMPVILRGQIGRGYLDTCLCSPKSEEIRALGKLWTSIIQPQKNLDETSRSISQNIAMKCSMNLKMTRPIISVLDEYFELVTHTQFGYESKP